VRGAVAKCGDVVGQSIEPYVDHVLGIIRNRNAPRKGRAADGEIAQRGTAERDDLIASSLGTDEVRLRGVERKQWFCKCGELEEVVLFLDGFGGAAALGARFSRPYFHVHLVKHAVLAGVAALIDVSVVANASPKALETALVAIRRRADV